jgi:hypothetical protein
MINVTCIPRWRKFVICALPGRAETYYFLPFVHCYKIIKKQFLQSKARFAKPRQRGVFCLSKAKFSIYASLGIE